MDRYDFIISVYCLVCEYYQIIKERYRIRRGGFASPYRHLWGWY